MSILIFVCVGSRNYPFDRLFRKLDELVEEGIATEDIFAQIGTSKYLPINYQYERFLSQENFLKIMSDANLVISHGASGSIMKALNKEKKVIAVTRLQKYGEHIDDHQIQINEAFAENNYVRAVLELDDLKEALLEYKNNDLNLSKWVNEDKNSVIHIIDKFIQENWSL